MRLTLEQLKAMSGDDVMRLWRSAEFPFDMATCGHCLTGHAKLGCSQHPHIVELVRPIRGDSPSAREAVTSHLEEFFAMRLFFDSIYRPETPAPQTEQAIAESEARTELVAKQL